MKKTISAIILMAGSSTRFVDDNNKLSWPKNYVKKGAFVAETPKDIKEILGYSHV